jgi:hypothetical protein
VKKQLLLSAVVAAAVLAGCKKGPSLDDPYPSDPIQERLFLMERMPNVLQKTTCACCSKPLAQCFQETVDHKPGRCPDTCGNCLFEGRTALALKKQNLSDDEVARRTLAVARGQEPPPPGVNAEMNHH